MPPEYHVARIKLLIQQQRKSALRIRPYELIVAQSDAVLDHFARAAGMELLKKDKV